MSKNSAQLSECIVEQASEWLALVYSGGITVEEQARLNIWLSEHQDHLQAYQQMLKICQYLGHLSATAEGRALKQSVSNKPFLMRPRIKLSNMLTGFWEQLSPRQSLGYLSLALVSIIAVGLFIFHSQIQIH